MSLANWYDELVYEKCQKISASPSSSHYAEEKLKIYRDAFERMISDMRNMEHNQKKLNTTRFYRLDPAAEDCIPRLVATTEESVSHRFDMSDAYEDESQVFYLEDDGKLYPVSVGKPARINTDDEAPFHYAAAAIIANGKPVGEVTYTDH